MFKTLYLTNKDIYRRVINVYLIPSKTVYTQLTITSDIGVSSLGYFLSFKVIYTVSSYSLGSESKHDLTFVY